MGKKKQKAIAATFTGCRPVVFSDLGAFFVLFFFSEGGGGFHCCCCCCCCCCCFSGSMWRTFSAVTRSDGDLVPQTGDPIGDLPDQSNKSSRGRGVGKKRTRHPGRTSQLIADDDLAASPVKTIRTSDSPVHGGDAMRVESQNGFPRFVVVFFFDF